MKKISCTAIVVAGGKGLRMGTQTKKQYIEIDSQCILFHTLKVVSESDYVDKIVVVVGKDDTELVKKLDIESKIPKPCKIVTGGKTRSESVKNGLMHVENCTVTAIHDGVRPLVSKKSFDECIENAYKYGASTLGVTPKETIKITKEGFVEKTVNRDSLVIIQTPQCFRSEIIKKAYENFSPDFTDDCMQVEKIGVKIHITKGEYENIKITTKEDLTVFKALKEERCEEK